MQTAFCAGTFLASKVKRLEVSILRIEREGRNMLTRAFRHEVWSLWLMLHVDLARLEGAAECSLCVSEVEAVMLCPFDLKALNLHVKEGSILIRLIMKCSKTPVGGCEQASMSTILITAGKTVSK